MHGMKKKRKKEKRNFAEVTKGLVKEIALKNSCMHKGITTKEGQNAVVLSPHED